MCLNRRKWHKEEHDDDVNAYVPSSGGRTVSRLPWMWSSFRCASSPISLGSEIRSLSLRLNWSKERKTETTNRKVEGQRWDKVTHAVVQGPVPPMSTHNLQLWQLLNVRRDGFKVVVAEIESTKSCCKSKQTNNKKIKRLLSSSHSSILQVLHVQNDSLCACVFTHWGKRSSQAGSSGSGCCRSDPKLPELAKNQTLWARCSDGSYWKKEEEKKRTNENKMDTYKYSKSKSALNCEQHLKKESHPRLRCFSFWRLLICVGSSSIWLLNMFRTSKFFNSEMFAGTTEGTIKQHKTNKKRGKINVTHIPKFPFAAVSSMGNAPETLLWLRTSWVMLDKVTVTSKQQFIISFQCI